MARFTGHRFYLHFDPGAAEYLSVRLPQSHDARDAWCLLVNSLNELVVWAAGSGAYIPRSTIKRLYWTEELPPYDWYGDMTDSVGNWWLVTSLDKVLAVDVSPSQEYSCAGHPTRLDRLMVCLENPIGFASALGFLL